MADHDARKGKVLDAAPEEKNTSFIINRRQFIQATGAIGLAAGIGGLPFNAAWAAGESAGGKPKKGGTLVMDVQPEPPTLASYISTSGPIGEVSSKVYDGLCEYDFNLKPIPSLATSWNVSSDGKTITFKLREKVKFHDGKPFTSADVQFGIMEVLKKYHPRGINTFKMLEAIDTPDAHTAVFHLSTPAPYMMMALSGYESPIVPKHLFSGTDIRNSKYANNPIGTGPFKFVEWKRGQYMRFDRNPEYWRAGEPHLDRVVARFIASGQTRSAAMQSGEINYGGFAAIPYSDVSRLTKIPGLAATTKGYEMQSPIIELDFNTRVKPFDDVRVRQAISYAIDRKFVIDNVWFGFGKPATGPINSNFAANGFYTSKVKNYNVPNGAEVANKLLDEAGYPRKSDGTRFEIVHDVTPYGDEWKRFGEYTKQALAKIGIKATLRYEDVPTWLRRIYTDYNFQLTSNWIQTLADPVIGVDRLYSSWSIRKGTVFVNDSGWSSPETDKLMKAAAVEIDPVKRAALYHKFQQLVVEAAPLIWVSELHFVTVYSTKYKDLTVSPLGAYSPFNQAWLSV
jgi:peptide/nickel transport system substrate-binding protein